MRELSRANRDRISEMWRAGHSVREISYELRFAAETIYAELRRGATGDFYPNTYRPAYDPDIGERVYLENIRRKGNRTPRKKQA